MCFIQVLHMLANQHTLKPQQPFFARYWDKLRWSGPYAPVIMIFLVVLPLLSLSRFSLMLWQAANFDLASAFQVLLQGMRVDLILAGLITVIPLLLLPLFAITKKWSYWQTLTSLWLIGALLLIVTFEAITPDFIAEYGTRPNALLIEYIQYPKEILSMLWKGFRTSLALVLIAVFSTTLLLRAFTKPWRDNTLHRHHWVHVLVYPLVLILVLLCIRSSIGHRPANPSMFAISNNPIINNLTLNSSYSVLYALYNLKHEHHSSQIYGDISFKDMLSYYDETRAMLHDTKIERRDANHPTLSFINASHPHKHPLNIVIILEESLGAGFVSALGGKPITPELDALKNEGWWFEELYATGTRSVRGIEAVVSGFPPTPARSVVKRSKAQQQFTTLASILAKQGYDTEFIYGGEAHFDNMRGFFLGNGFKHIIEQKDFDHPAFVGSWGVSDEDLFKRTHASLLQHHADHQPFFTLVFTSSNHAPFEFPDGRIKLDDPTHKATETNAVRYASYALGQFFKQAKASPYYQDTLFLVVADHDIRVRGDHLIPVEHFHIPGLILGADIHPKVIKTVASQIDLAPTLLSLAGINTATPMIGRDISREPEDLPGRAMMQYNDHYGWMEGHELTILRPNKAPVFAHYEPQSHRLIETQKITNTKHSVEHALSHSLLAEWLYQHHEYQTAN